VKTVKLNIKMESALMIGGYSHSNPFADKCTASNPDGLPVIPASVIKGAIRMEFEKLFAQKCTKGEKCDCEACKIFGKEGDYEGLVRFYDAHLKDKKEIFTEKKDRKDDNGKKDVPTGYGYNERPGVVINRKTRTSEDNKLFLFETTAQFDKNEQLEFETKLDVSPLLKNDCDLWKKLRKAIALVFSIGGGRSRGLGFCQFDLIEDSASDTTNDNIPPLSGNSVKVILSMNSQHVTIGSNKPYQHFVQTHDYIPGSTLRGALAKGMVRKLKETGKGNGDIAEMLNENFTKSGLIFDDCLPTEGKTASKVIPLSARTCKVYNGFLDDYKDVSDKPHGVVDVVISDLIYDKAELPIANLYKCTQCSNVMTDISGYYKKGAKYEKVEISKRVVTRSAQNRKLRNSAEGQLFSIESIEKPADKTFNFVGTIRNINSDMLTKLDEWNCKNLHVGAEKSTGYGNIKIEFENLTGKKDIQKRIDKFNEKLKAKMAACKESWGEICKSGISDETYFTVDLLSDTILFDENGLYAGLMPEIWEIKTDEGIIVAERVRSYARTELVSGFMFKLDSSGNKQFMPKRVQQAIKRGSVFVYKIYGNKLDEILPELLKLEEKGIGERREEGFGHIRICDEFHYEKEVY
jgi:CRISPR-associated protein Csx10